MARLSGFSPVIVTASAKHTDYLKSLGATHVLDRNLSPSALKSEVEKITKKPIKYVYDTISLEDTQKQGDAILALGGYFMLVMPPSVDTTDRHFAVVQAFRKLDFNVEALSALYGKLTELLENGVIQVTFLVPLIVFLHSLLTVRTLHSRIELKYYLTG